MGLTGLEIAVVLAATTLGACVQGSIGFGLGLLGAPVLALVDPTMVPGPVLAAGIPLTLGVLVRERRSLDVHTLRWALAGRVGGTVAAAATLALLPARPLAVLFACLVLVAVGLSVAGLSVRPRTTTLAAAGVASGFMGTATSIGGPPIALLFQRSRGSELRATVGVVLAFGAVVSLVGLIAVGRYGEQELRLTAVLLPGVAAGYLASGPLGRWLDHGWVRPAVLAAAAASAVAVLVDQLVSW